MIVRFLVLFYFLVGCLQLSGQEGYFGKSLHLGTSLSYIPTAERDFEPVRRFNEWTFNVDATVRLNSFLYGGMRYRGIRTSGTLGVGDRPSETHYTVGLVGQIEPFRLFTKKALLSRDRLLIEFNWDYGNYCTCERIDPHKVEGLQYLGFGVSYDLAITPKISLDMGLSTSYIQNHSNFSSSYTHYILGVNFLVGKRNDP